MRILLVNKFWYQHGGSERVAFLTKKILEKAGHEVKIFGMKNPKNEFSNEYFSDYVDYKTMRGWKRVVAGLKAIYNFEAKHKFEKLVKDFRPDVIHFHNIYHQLSFSLLDVGKKYKVPMVMTLHDYKMISPNYMMFHHGKIDESCVMGHYYRCLFNNCMENIGFSYIATKEALFRKFRKYQSFINLYISPSRFLKDKFVSAGWNEKKLVVIPNPLESSGDLSTKDGDYVVFVGRLAKEKGIDVLLRAAEKTPEIKYKIVGDGPEYSSLSSKRPQNVEFIGFLENQKAKKMIADSRLVVAPSIWYENCPLSILEAKALGKIVIASRIGGIPELLPEELLFTPGKADDLAEKIKHYYNLTEDKRLAFGEKLRSEVKIVNSEEKYYQSLLNVYEQTLAD